MMVNTIPIPEIFARFEFEDHRSIWFQHFLIAILNQWTEIIYRIFLLTDTFC